MRTIGELPLHESFSIPYRELLYGPDKDNRNYVRRPLSLKGPRTLMSCKRLVEGSEPVPLSFAIGGENGIWRVCTCIRGEDRFYATATNRDEALALVMDAADLSPDGMTDGAFGKAATLYEQTLRLRARLVARNDVEPASLFAPVRQIVSQDDEATLCRYLYHPKGNEEIFALFRRGSHLPSFQLRGHYDGWSPVVSYGGFPYLFAQDRPLDCVRAMFEQTPDMSGHERIGLFAHFSEALAGLSDWREAQRRFDCPTYRNPFIA